MPNSSSHLRILTLFLALVGLGATASAQQPATPVARAVGALQTLVGPLGPQPCTAPPVACPSPGVPQTDVFNDRFGTLAAGCPTCVACTIDPNAPGCANATCQFSQWTSSTGQVPALQVPKFTPPPGVCAQLVSAEFLVRGTLCGLLRVESRDPLNGCLAAMSLGASIQVLPNGLPFLTFPPLDVEHIPSPVPLGPFDGNIDFDGPSGETVVCPATQNEVCVRIVNPADLMALLDSNPNDGVTEFLVFDHQANDISSKTGCAPVTFLSDPYAGVEIEVRYRYCVDQPPVVGNDSAGVCRNGSVDIPVTANDSDPEGQLDCASLQITVQPMHGTATVMGCTGVGASCPGCVVRYVPAPNYFGPDSFTYTIADNLGCSTPGNVSVTVCATNAVDDSGFTVCRGAQISIPVTQNDSSTCGSIDCTTLMITTQPMHGTAVVNGCNVVYTATDPSFTGVDTFVYSVGNSGTPVCTDTGTVSVQVCATDAQDDLGFSVCQGAQVSIPVTQNDTTSCGTLDCATIQITQQPAMGSVSVQGCNIVYTAPVNFTGDVSFAYSIANSLGCRDSATVRVTVCGVNANNDSNILLCQLSSITIPVTNNDSSTCGSINCATLMVTVPPLHGTAVVQGCTIVYTHTDPNHSGPDSFTYRVGDTVGCSDTATVNLSVCLTVAQDDSARTCAGQAVSIPVRANDGTTCGMLDNGTIVVTQQPANGTAMVSGANIVYTPNAGFVGQDSFVYRIGTNQAPFCTDTATVRIDVCAVDARNDNNIRLCQLTSITIPVTNNDTSSCGTIDCTTLQVTTQPAHGTAVVQGCTIVYTHTDPNHSGTDSFVYRVGDTVGCSDTATVNLEICLTVAQDDTAEVCNGQSVTIAARSNDGTTCGMLDCNTITIVTQPQHGTVMRRGCNLIYTSTDPTFAGQDCFTYSIATNQAPFCADTARVCVNVCRTDAVDDMGLRVCAGASLTIPVTANDSSTCGSIDCTTLQIVNPPANGTVQVQGCNIVYTAPASFAGQVSFTYRVSNSGSQVCTDTGTVSLEVCRTVAQNDTGAQVCRGQSVTIPVTANDSSTCGGIDCSTLQIVTPPTHGSVQVQGCNVVYTATDVAFTGVDSFTYRVANASDPACFAQGRVDVTVCATVAEDDMAVVCPGETICTPVTANDSTSCGRLSCDTLQIVTPPLNGSAQVQGCTICYTANPGFTGQDSLVYRVANGQGCSDTATLRIEVQPEPIARDDQATLPEPPAPIIVPVLDNDSAGQGCVLLPGTVTIVSQGSYGTASPNADGTVTYVPGASFPDNGEDVFCYEVQNDCGCRDTACVVVKRMSCPMVNRRMPGSLLVFPEFDNRQANKTLISITNTNCDPMSQTIRVEIVYVNESNCLEFNRTITLTPCDTWTALTSADNPNFQRGYIYAFAKDVQNRAISFNWLIGEEMITDGIDQLEHGINAVVFKAIPPLRQPTDVDQDGIRDLDDVEYQMAPDVLLVPRFLGQDDDFGSKLVLLNLSGGKQFTATVDFEIFNDNEELFSAQESFRCWKKWRLVDISNAFRNSFLQSTDHDPLEILGEEGRESGWFRIDGNSAFSSMEQIVDPALLGYMIERSGDWTAADLPWELCAQANGDLLPLGLFGDGPDYVAGDNE